MIAILVVNADDFGLTEGTNRAIIDAHQHGIVTSTSLLANGIAFDHAIALAKKTPTLGVGVHLTLTEGSPIAEHVEVLLDTSGKFPLSNQPFARALLTGKLPREAIRREFEAQCAKIRDAGIMPTHIDGHKYIHLLPGITAIAAEVAKQFNIKVMRLPHRVADPPSRLARLPGLLAICAMGTIAYRAASGLDSVDRVMGFVDTGHLDPTAIRRLLKMPRPGRTELLTHPAYRTPQLDALSYSWIAGYDFDAETASVSDPAIRAEADSAGWKLKSFGDFRQP